MEEKNRHSSEETHQHLIDLGKLVSDNTNIGYITLTEEGKLKLVGFDGLYNHRGQIELINDVMLITQNDDMDSHKTVLFDDNVLSSPIMIEYFRETGALNCLFVKVWNVFTQCKGVYIIDNDTDPNFDPVEDQCKK